MLTYSISIVILGILSYQDFKSRRISLLLLIALFMLFFGMAYQVEGSLNAVIRNFAFNAGFVLIQFILVKIYFSLRNKRIEALLDTYIGKGDLLFFIVCCLAFSVTWFIPFYIGSLLLALIATIISNLFRKVKTLEIPLAGVMSLVMLLSITIKLTHKSLNFYDDSYLFQLMNFPQ